MNASLSGNVVGSADKETHLRMRLLTYKLSAISLSAAMTTGSMRVSQDDAIRQLFLALNIEPANNAQSETGYGHDCAPLPVFSARDVMQANSYCARTDRASVC